MAKETKTQDKPDDVKTALVEAKTTAVALPSAALERMKAAKPTDDFKANDLMIPWLTLVQTSSGYMKKNNENFIPEANEGDIIDTLTKRLSATAQVILCKFETHYTTWKPGGGKLVKQWFTDPSGYEAAGSEFGVRTDSDGNEISPSAVYYILRLNADSGAADPMIWSLGGTQVKKSRRINSLARADMLDGDGVPFIPPIYARIFDLSSRGESGNDKNWAGWVAEPGAAVLSHPKFGEQWFVKAEKFREQIEKGNVRPLPPADRAEASEDDDEPQRRPPIHGMHAAQQAPAGKVDARDIPF